MVSLHINNIIENGNTWSGSYDDVTYDIRMTSSGLCAVSSTMFIVLKFINAVCDDDSPVRD